MPRQSSVKIRLIIGVVIFFGACILAAYAVCTQNSITAHDQVLGEYVILDEVRISNPFGATIALTINGAMKGGQRVGTSPHLAPGTYMYIGIPLRTEEENGYGANKAIRPKHGDIVYISVFASSNDERDAKNDHPLLYSFFGKPITEKIKVF
jgi:hypothetical protein